MRAAVYETSGTSAVLQVREVPTPEPGPGEVRVRIALAGVNPTDWKVIRRAGPPAGAFAVPGQDGAGTIDAVGEGVDKSRVGQRVWILFAARERRWGTAAEFSVVPAGRAIPLPASASFELGASLGIPALTAAHCLGADGPVTGRAVLVSGGAGAVGHAAIELATFGNARVATTVSSAEKGELARAAGAELVVNYRTDGAAQEIRQFAPEGIDRFVEVSLASNLELDLHVAAPQAVISAYADDAAGGAVQLAVRALMTPNIVLRFVFIYTVTREQLAAAIALTSDALAAGALTTLPLHRFSLDQTAAAHEAVERGAVGKVVIEP
jgi:NADPH2:quinone reductase